VQSCQFAVAAEAGLQPLRLDATGNYGTLSATTTLACTGVAPVPLPASGWLMVSGLAGLADARFRRRAPGASRTACCRQPAAMAGRSPWPRVDLRHALNVRLRL